MRWNVEGADARTGAEKMIQVTATSRSHAEALARKQGLLVSAVHESSVLTPAESLDEMVGSAATRPSVAPALPPQPVEYRKSNTSPAVPDYSGLRFASSVLIVFAMIFYLVGALGALAAVLTLGAGVSTGQPGLGILAALTQIVVTAFGPLAVAAILHGFSAGCVALRDIARNSYRFA